MSGGSEAVEAAWKLARQYHAHRGQPMRRKVIARKLAYHGTTMGALSITGITAIRTPFEPLVSGVRHVANTNRYRCKYCADKPECTLGCADEIAEAIEFEGPETVAMVITEPVQNSGGTFTPHPRYHQRVREICDAYGVLQVSDEVICAFGRLGEWFGAIKYDFEPDIITTAKGLTSAYQPLGAVMISDKVAEPFLAGGDWMHGITFGGHPVATAVALRNIEIMEREDVLGNVRRNEGYFHEQLVATPGAATRSSATCAAPATSSRSSSSRTRRRARAFSAEECDVLLRGFLSEALFAGGPDLPRGRPRRPRDPALAAADRRTGRDRRGDRGARRGAAACRETHANRLSPRRSTFDLERSPGYACAHVTEVSVAVLDARLRRITTGVTGDALLLSLIALLPR